MEGHTSLSTALVLLTFVCVSDPGCPETSSQQEHRTLRLEARECPTIIRDTLPTGKNAVLYLRSYSHRCNFISTIVVELVKKLTYPDFYLNFHTVISRKPLDLCNQKWMYVGWLCKKKINHKGSVQKWPTNVSFDME